MTNGKPLPRSFPDASEAARRVMQGNRCKDTRPEMVVRRLVHGLGYRYRLHRNDLPGRPDLTFASRKAIIEVRGCFWHQHAGCRLATLPSKRADYWHPKLTGNVRRDEINTKALENAGWRVLPVWECEISDLKMLAERLMSFLEAESLRRGDG